jgi:hypothetical protein
MTVCTIASFDTTTVCTAETFLAQFQNCRISVLSLTNMAIKLVQKQFTDQRTTLESPLKTE